MHKQVIWADSKQQRMMGLVDLDGLYLHSGLSGGKGPLKRYVSGLFNTQQPRMGRRSKRKEVWS